MQTLKRTWFISDLHLDAGQPEITSQFMTLLKKCDDSVDDLYILGDLFELWIGDDDDSPFHAEIIAGLKRVTERGTRIHIMHGNRDFLLGKQFMRQTGCNLLPEEIKINLYGSQILLMHGDKLCTADAAYQRARKFAFNPVLQKIFLMLPLSLRKKIAARARAASRKHTSSTEFSIMDTAQDEVENTMRLHQVTTLIHGHTHKPNIHTFVSNDKKHTRIVLPAWHDGGSVLEWREDGTYSMQGI